MALKVGNNMKLYYNTGTNASPTWVEIKMVGDVTVNLGVNEAEVDLRVTSWVLNLPAKNTGGFEFTLANDIGGTVYDALRVLALARTIKQFASANADIAVSATQYFKAFAFFNNFPWSQPTQEIASHDAGLALAYQEESGSLVEPAWATTP
jgi:hypothetical protein